MGGADGKGDPFMTKSSAKVSPFLKSLGPLGSHGPVKNDEL